MKRSILFSTLVIGAVLAIVAGASTFATFTDQATGSQTVTAGSVDVEVNSANDAFTITFGGASCSVPGDMAFGDSCTFTLNVKNAGSLSFTTGFTVTETDANSCFTTALTGLPAGDVEGGDADSDHDPADTHAATLTTTLDNGAAVCQGAANLVSVTIDATQSASPHD